MTNAQYELLNLLDEIDAICRKNNLPYFLIEDPLLFAVCKQDFHGYSMDIAMRYSDIERLRNCIERSGTDSGEFENRSVNPDMPGDYWRYVNPDTLMLDISHIHDYRCHGIAVNLHILRKDKQNKEGSPKASRGVGLLSRIFRRPGSGAAPASSGEYLKDIKAPSALAVGDTVLRFPAGYWSSSKNITLMKHRYRIASNPEFYLAQRYGEQWSRIPPSKLKEPISVIASTQIPYRTYLESEAANKYLRDSDLPEQLHLSEQRYRDNYESLEPARFAGWDVFYATGARIRLWKQYMPQKAHILSVWHSGRHDMAMLLMEDYRSQQDEFLKKNLALCFDRELWEIYLQWLSENGRDDQRSRLESLLWPEHLEPISEAEAMAWLASARGESAQ